MTLALLLMCESGNNEPEWWLVHGTLATANQDVVFVRATDTAILPLDDEWLNRVRPVQPEQADIFKPSVFYLPLRVGPLPENADPEEYVFTGLQSRR